jgi:hypothetical protein
VPGEALPTEAMRVYAICRVCAEVHLAEAGCRLCARRAVLARSLDRSPERPLASGTRPDLVPPAPSQARPEPPEPVSVPPIARRRRRGRAEIAMIALYVIAVAGLLTWLTAAGAW